MNTPIRQGGCCLSSRYEPAVALCDGPLVGVVTVPGRAAIVVGSMLPRPRNWRRRARGPGRAVTPGTVGSRADVETPQPEPGERRRGVRILRGQKPGTWRRSVQRRLVIVCDCDSQWP